MLRPILGIFAKMTNFFRGEVPGEKYPIFHIFSACFFVVYHQFAGVTGKNEVVYITCPPRVKMYQLWPKSFFENFTHFLQNNETTRILMLYMSLNIFAKMTTFSRGAPLGKNDQFSPIFGCFSVVKQQEPGVAPEKQYLYLPVLTGVHIGKLCWKPILSNRVHFL